MHQSFLTTALPPTGKGGDYDFSAFSSTPREQTGGQNFALCPALRNRKSPWGKENLPGVRILMSKPHHFPCTEGTLEK